MTSLMVSEASVRALLADVTGGSEAISICVRPSIRASSARLHEVDVGFADGHRWSLVLKELGAKGMMPTAVGSRPVRLTDPALEIRVYERVLAGAALGTPVLVASRVDRHHGRYLLLLERIDAPQLQWTVDPSAWDRTAAWLGHGHARLRPWVDADLLPATGPPELQRRLDRARRRQSGAELRDRTQLAWVASRYHQAVEILAAAPRSVMHGQLYPSNVLAEDRPEGRIAVVDWELATVGPAVIDLATLVTGLAHPAQRTLLEQTYLEASDGPSRAALEQLGIRRAVDAGRLVMAIQWLGWTRRADPPPDQVFDWLAEAVDAAERIG